MKKFFLVLALLGFVFVEGFGQGFEEFYSVIDSEPQVGQGSVFNGYTSTVLISQDGVEEIDLLKTNDAFIESDDELDFGGFIEEIGTKTQKVEIINKVQESEWLEIRAQIEQNGKKALLIAMKIYPRSYKAGDYRLSDQLKEAIKLKAEQLDSYKIDKVLIVRIAKTQNQGDIGLAMMRAQAIHNELAKYGLTADSIKKPKAKNLRIVRKVSQ